jgi:hypothetical protein
MATSYNGWSASTNPANFGGLDNRVIPGTNVKLAPGVRAGDVATVLFYVAEQLHKRVEKAITPGCWGFNYRANVNNPKQLSCHASATCFDYNAPKHPNGKKNTFTPAQFAEIDKILREVNGVVRQLRGYDEMHFEICANAAAVAKVAAKIRAGALKPTPAPNITDDILEFGDSGEEVERLQAKLNKLFPKYSNLKVDGDFGIATKKVVEEFQRRSGLEVDGRVGPVTKARLGGF